MFKSWKQALAILAVLGMPGIASAHEFICEKTVNGAPFASVNTYPTWVTWSVDITNVHPTETSDALEAYDLLFPTKWNLAPFSLGVGESRTTSFAFEIGSYEDCLLTAAGDGLEDNYIDNTFRVRWDMGDTQCSARLYCVPPPPCEGDQCPPCEGDNCPCEGDNCPPCEGDNCPCEGDNCPPCEGDNCPCEGDNCPPPPGEATRTMGFFSTHEVALQACVDEGSIDLGYVTVNSLESALGMLWGSVPRFDDGTFRNQLERQRFLLARQLMVSICNVRLFGAASPGIVALIDDARTALSATDCDDIADLVDPVDTYNNSGDAEPFPPGFVPGPATPTHAQSIADDPTTEGTEVCD